MLVQFFLTMTFMNNDLSQASLCFHMSITMKNRPISFVELCITIHDKSIYVSLLAFTKDVVYG